MFPHSVIRSASATVALFTFGYLVTRLYQLTILPIYGDEAVYMNFARILAEDPIHNLFVSKIDAKPPFFFWCLAPFRDMFDDPLVGSRLVSVIAGGLGFWGFYRIAHRHYSREHAFAASLFFILCPFMLFYQRLALIESLLGALSVWMVFVAMNIAEAKRDPGSGYWALGALSGLAFLTKTTALLVFPVPVAMFFFAATFRQAGFWKGVLKAATVFLLIVLPYYLNDPDQKTLPGRSLIYHYPGSFMSWETASGFPWDRWWNNFLVMVQFYWDLITLPGLVLAFLGMLLALKSGRAVDRALLVWALAPIVVIIIVGNVFFSRYLYIAAPPLLLLMASGWMELAGFIRRIAAKRQNLHPKAGQAAAWVLLAILLVDSVDMDRYILTDPARLPINDWNRLIFIEGLPSGYGVKEGARFLSEEMKRGEITILAPASWTGNPLEGILIYLEKETGWRLIPVVGWPEDPRLVPGDKTFPLRHSRFKEEAQGSVHASELGRAYFIHPLHFPREAFEAANPDFEKAWQYEKPGGAEKVVIYKRKAR